jgi:predicted MFS family arabinose efflux permease
LIKVFQLTNSSTAVALIIMAFGVATIFFGALAGVYADRFDRKWLLTIINFLQAGSIALYFVVGGDFWGLFTITFLYSSLNQFYIPAEAPSIPNLVPENQILIANSYFAFTNSAALIIGFASAGPIALAFGQKAPFVTGTILLIIAGLATATLPSLKPKTRDMRIWYEFKEGIAHFWQNKNLHFPLLTLVSIQIINGMMITIAPAFMERSIGINLNSGSIFVIAPLGVGILVGALLLGWEERYFAKKDLVLLGFFGMGFMIFALSFINYFIYKYFYYSIIAFVIGLFNAHIFAPSHSLLQTHALAHVRGRIYASLYILLQVAATLPTIIIGVLADKVALNYIVGGLGVLLVLLGILIWPGNKPRNLMITQ